MLAAAATCNDHVLVIGTDCPALTEVPLRVAANDLRGGPDVILIPADDGGYVLSGTRSEQPALFAGIAWGTKWCSLKLASNASIPNSALTATASVSESSR